MAKLKLTNGLIEKAKNYIAFGMTAEDTYTVLGISKGSWFSWLKRGKEATDNNYPKRDAIFRKFYETIEKAKLAREITYLERIDKATKKDWRAAAFLLEKLYPEKYAKRAIEAKVQHSGAVGSLNISVADLSDEEAETLVREALKTIKFDISKAQSDA
jgi:3-mercaptopyruvate sulfurtransferase SseA